MESTKKKRKVVGVFASLTKEERKMIDRIAKVERRTISAVVAGMIQERHRAMFTGNSASQSAS